MFSEEEFEHDSIVIVQEVYGNKSVTHTHIKMPMDLVSIVF